MPVEQVRGGSTCTDDGHYVNIAAYRFVELDELVQRRAAMSALCRRLALKGSVLLSHEGINLFVAGTPDAIDSFVDTLFADKAFRGMEIKRSMSVDQPFNRMLVKIKREIIPFGVEDIDPQRYTSARISPQLLKTWLDEGRQVTLLDVRNQFEFDVGSFETASPMPIDDFRSFPEAVEQLPPSLRRGPVVTFCTGGIRCEKAAPYLEQHGFEEVYQLDGGILKYFEECGGNHYRGECFVFDKRVALDSELHETETTQCYACQGILSVRDRESWKFEEGKSCPHCYKPPEVQSAEFCGKRDAAIRAASAPLPGSAPYDNVKPIHVTGEHDGTTVIEFLSGIHTRLSRDEWWKVCEAGCLLINDCAVTPDHRIRAGQILQHVMPDTVEPDVNVDIRILFEDPALVVVDKPAPLPMHPCGRFNRNTLTWLLEKVYRPLRLRPAHRLDANTSGVVVFSKSRRIASRLQAQFEVRDVRKAYLVRVNGEPESERFVSTTPLGAKPQATGARLPDPKGMPACTGFRVVSRFPDGTSLVEAEPRTGRTNQIRVHLWDAGCPVVGDPLYLPARRLGSAQTLSPSDQPLCLHALRIEIVHPLSAERLVFESPAPPWGRV